MKRIKAAMAAGLLAATVAACGDSGVGAAGPVTTLPGVTEPPVATTAAPTTAAPTTAAPATTAPGTTAPAPATTTTSTTAPPASDEATRSTKVYLLLDSTDPFRPGPLLLPVHREIPATLSVATNSISALLEGPTPEERSAVPAISTAIPDDVTLNGIVISDGLATIDFSAGFAAGAGTFSEFARLAQVVYTLTQFPTVDSVEFLLDGVPVTSFASHGLDVGRPQVRADYETVLPFIFVDGPSHGGPVGNPARVTGQASVFESTFNYRLTGDDGATLAEGPVTGGSGLGFGPFDFTVGYDVAAVQTGALTVFEMSAQSGEMINVRTYPVELRPAA